MELTDEDFEAALQSLSSSAQNRSVNSTAISILAVASKHNPAARQRLADPTALKTLVEVVECSINDSLETLKLALRCIANACADRNSARDIIADLGFSWALECLHLPEKEVQILTTKVLYNICADDHEASQRKCFEIGIHFALVTLCANSTEDAEECNCAIDLLFWICGQKATVEGTLSRPIPEASLSELLLLPLLFAETADLDTLASLIETVLAFTRDPIIQMQVVTMKQVGKVWKILEISQRKAATLDPEVEDAAEESKLLLGLSMSLVWCLSDTAALPEFSKTYDLNHEEVKAVINYIHAHASNVSDHKDPNGLQLTAACQTVGNLLWALPTETYGYLTLQNRIHRPLLEVIVHTGSAKEDAGVLHSVAGLLIQLSRPSVEARETIGSDTLARPALERLCRHEMPNVQQEGVKLLRALGRECSANQEHFTDLAREAALSASENSNPAVGNVGSNGAEIML